MTIDERTRMNVLSKRGMWSGDKTADYFGISKRSVYRIWNQFDADTFQFENQLYTEIAFAMKHAEQSPIDLKKRERDILEYISYLQDYGDEPIDVLRQYYS